MEHEIPSNKIKINYNITQVEVEGTKKSEPTFICYTNENESNYFICSRSNRILEFMNNKYLSDFQIMKCI